ncbi:helicase HerA domain-containing protein [Pseudolysinimonas sp.]
MNNPLGSFGKGKTLASALLAKGNSIRIGGIHRLDFAKATVLTHDMWKSQAGGIPQFSFLLATAADITSTDDSGEDDEVLLLRVEGTAALSLESDLHAVREEALRDALTRQESIDADAILTVDLDPFTKNRASFTGLTCRILGTFYEEQIDGQTVLQFGSDVDNFYATSTYRVLKPTGAGLSTIASYMRPERAKDADTVRIGAVRYSATRRRAITANQAASDVFVNMNDFIGNKTGLLGMTRSGKSNTAKILIARTFIASERRRKDGKAPIGQLIFDPQGEYASDNVQDKTAIASIGVDHVRIYRFGATGSANVRPLGVNFFDVTQIATVQQMVAEALSESTAGYILDFANQNFAPNPADQSANARASRGRLLLYGSLLKAGFKPPKNYTVEVKTNAALRTAVETHIGRTVFVGPRHDIATDDVDAVIRAIIKLADDGDADVLKWVDEPSWEFTLPIYTTKTSSKNNTRGYRNLTQLLPFHNPDTKRDIAVEIYDDLMEGRVVIVDLHLGTGAVIQSLATIITEGLINGHMEKFTSNKEVQPVQVMLEEAHNLFGETAWRRDKPDTWIRLAKEASKLNIGMIYATQEVSGVAHQVKANTANWVVSHLNNRTELAELGKFYDFASYSDAILASEDRGYVRLKTLSSPYIVPVQIEKYDETLINLARAEVNLPNLAD